jgi:hypothetical protein
VRRPEQNRAACACAVLTRRSRARARAPRLHPCARRSRPSAPTASRHLQAASLEHHCRSREAPGAASSPGRDGGARSGLGPGDRGFRAPGRHRLTSPTTKVTRKLWPASISNRQKFAICGLLPLVLVDGLRLIPGGSAEPAATPTTEVTTLQQTKPVASVGATAETQRRRHERTTGPVQALAGVGPRCERAQPT